MRKKFVTDETPRLALSAVRQARFFARGAFRFGREMSHHRSGFALSLSQEWSRPRRPHGLERVRKARNFHDALGELVRGCHIEQLNIGTREEGVGVSCNL